VEIQNYSLRHINAVIQRRAGEMYWKLTGFYGHPETARRPEAWALLRHLSLLSPMPWLCLGDFNEILSNGEKLSGPPRPYAQMASFQRAPEDSGLNDMGFCGPQFTWCNVMCVLMSTRKCTNRLQYSVCKCEVESTGKWSNVGVLFNQLYFNLVPKV
jgi:hypothetical protein